MQNLDIFVELSKNAPMEVRKTNKLLSALSNETPFLIVFLIYTFISWLSPFFLGSLIAYPLFLWAGLIFVTYVVRFGRNYLKHILPGAVFMASYCITLILNRHYGLGLDHLKTLGWIFIFNIAIYGFAYRKNKILCNLHAVNITFQILTFLGSGLSLVTYFLRYSYMLVMPNGEVRVLGFVNGKRLFGIYRDPNFASVLAVAAIVLAFFMYFQKKQDRKFLYFLVPNVLVQIMFIGLSYSRTGLISLILAAGMLIIGLFARSRQKVKAGELSQKRWRMLIVSSMAIGAVTIFLTVNPIWESNTFYGLLHGGETKKTEPIGIEITALGEGFDNFLQSPTGTKDAVQPKIEVSTYQQSGPIYFSETETTTLAAEDVLLETESTSAAVSLGKRDDLINSANERLELADDALSIWKHVPVFGTGDRNLHAVAKDVEPKTLTARQSKVVHNAYLYLLVTAGIVGFLLVIGLMVYLIIRWIRCFYVLGKLDFMLWLSAIPLAILILSGLLLQDLFLTNSTGSFIYWFGLGVIAVITDSILIDKKQNKNNKIGKQIAALILAFTFIVTPGLHGSVVIHATEPKTTQAEDTDNTQNNDADQEKERMTPRIASDYATLKNPAFPKEIVSHKYNYKGVRFDYSLEIAQALSGEAALEKANYFDENNQIPANADLYLIYVQLIVNKATDSGNSIDKGFSSKHFSVIDESGQTVPQLGSIQLKNPFDGKENRSHVEGWMHIILPKGTKPLLRFNAFEKYDDAPVFNLAPNPKQPLELISFETGGRQIYRFGESILLSARAKGGLQEHFPLRFAYTVDGKVIKNFNWDRKVRWLPNAPGTYEIGLQVTDGMETISETVTVVVKSDSPMVVDELRMISPQANVGEAAWLNVNVGFGTSPMSYRYYQIEEDETIRPLTDWLRKPMYAWIPDKSGTHKIMVEVRDSAGYLVQKTIEIDVQEARTLEVTSLFSEVPTEFSIGSPVYFEAGIKGGNYPYQYKFYAKRKSGETVHLNAQADPHKSRKTWIPQSLDITEVGVMVTDANGQTANISHSVSINEAESFDLSVRVSSRELTIGKPVLVEGNTVSDILPYKIQPVIIRPDGTEASPENPYNLRCFTWRPQSEGTYQIGLRVHHSGNNKVEVFDTVVVKEKETK